MNPAQDKDGDCPAAMPGAFRLFRVSGITVFLHWAWLLVALIEVQHPFGKYTASAFGILEYLALFGIVLFHECGHAFACRSVGGKADRILLWPLGGVAYVEPPQRPGAVLWSIAAGPLVNVVLAPVLFGLWLAMRNAGVWQFYPNGFELLRAVNIINFGLLVFNLLPVYPLDGGQILHSLLWFVMGRAKSLLITSVIGFVGVGFVVLLAVGERSVLAGVVALFIFMSCWRGLLSAIAMVRRERMPRRGDFDCPACKAEPMIGPHWECNRCQTLFDTFQTNAGCPQCGTLFLTTRCLECGESNPMPLWKKWERNKQSEHRTFNIARPTSN